MSLDLGLNSDDKSSYLIAFETYYNWIFSSLDEYKPELLSTLFPLFVHSITVLGGRFHIKLSEEVWLNLKHFLRSNHLTTFLGILNDHIQIALHSGPPAAVSPPLDLPGYTVNSLPNLLPVQLNVPGRPWSLRLVHNSEAATSIPSPSVARPDPLTRELLDKLVLPRALVGKSGISASIKAQEVANDTGAAGGQSLPHTGQGLVRTDLEPSPLKPHTLFATVSNALGGMVCMQINAGLSQAVAGFKDGAVRVWSLDPNADVSSSPVVAALRAHPDRMTEVLPRPNKRCLVGSLRSADDDVGPVSKWDRPYLPMLDLRAHHRAVFGVSQSPDPQSRLLLSVSADDSIRLWDVGLATCTARFESGLGPAWSVAFGPLGHFFATAHRSGACAVFAVDRVSPLRLLVGHTSDVTCCAWHPASSLVTSGSDDRFVRLWDLRSAESVRLLVGAAAPVSCVALSHDGHSAVAGSEDGSLVLWDLTAGRLVARLLGHTHAVYSMAYCSSDSALASGGADSCIRLWDLRQWRGAGEGSRSSSSSVLRPHGSMFTKHTPVYFVGYGSKNLLCGGGAFTLPDSNTVRDWEATNGQDSSINQSMSLGLAPLNPLSA